MAIIALSQIRDIRPESVKKISSALGSQFLN